MRQKFVWLSALLLLAGAVPASGQTRIVTGRVVDSLSGDAITSGQVSVQGTTLGTTVRDDGTFTIAVPVRDVTLAVRSIGFKRREVPAAAGVSTVQVALERDYFQLEAIVVTGQATGVERKNLANAVSSVSAAEVTKVPQQSVELALQGKVAGADIRYNTSAPGGGVRVKLRGQTTLTGASTPLYVVDGVIVSDASVSPGTNIITRASTTGGVVATANENNTNRIADLNPNDIESVEVLKGAAASAIYGSKASNGVIMITTKRGRSGAPQFSISQRFGVSRISKKMGLRDFGSDLAAAVDAKGPTANTFFVPNTFFDHEEELYGRRPLSYETSASVNGGTDNTRFFASGLVKHDGGIVTNTYYDKRSLRLNLEQNIGSRITFGANSQIINSVAARGLFHNDNSGTSYGMVLPHTPSYVDLRAVCPDGSRQILCEGGVYPVNPFVASNPLQTASVLQNTETVWRSILGGNLTFAAIRSTQHTLHFKVNGGADYFTQRDRLYSPPELYYEDDDGLPGTAGAGTATNLNLNLNGNLVHTFKTSAFSATTSLGGQYEWRDQDILRNVGQNLVGALSNVNSGTVSILTENRSYTKDQGFFAQEEFLTLNERLLLTVGITADRSSNNSDPEKFYLYPKAAASYRLNLIQGMVDEVKVRVAFGQSGNQPLYGRKFTEVTSGNISGSPSALNTVRIGGTRAAADVRPERQLELEGGIDASLFGGRASLEATVYEKRITELLLNRSLPPYTGFTTEVFNGGAMRTRGVELGLGVVPIQTPTVSWSGRFNFSLTRSILTSLPVPSFRTGGTLTGFHVFEQGKSPNTVWGYDSTNTPPTALVVIGNREPNFTLGYSNDVNFKKLRMYFLVDWKKGGVSSDGAMRHYDLSLNAAQSCDTRVQPSNKCIGRERQEAFYASKSTAALVRDNGYVKVREVSLSLDLPQSMVTSVWSGARFVRLTLSGRNLLTFSDWLGYDPEGVESGGINSPVRELGPYPPSRSFWFSVDFGF